MTRTEDFVPVNFYLKSPFVLCVHPDVPGQPWPI